jgi:hypothetical protein
MKYQPRERKSALRPPFPSRLFLLALTLQILLSGCFPLPYKNLDPRCDTWRKKDFSTVSDDLMSVEDEFELLLCVRAHSHPDSGASWSAESRLTRMGAHAVSFLRTKLQDTSNTFVISNIIDVFGRINDNKTYNFKEDNELIDIIISSILRMHSDKERARIILSHLSLEAYKRLMLRSQDN